MTLLSEQQAEEILGGKFFGTRDWDKLLGSKINRAFLDAPPEIAWTSELLNSPCPFLPGKTIAETHFAYLGLPEIDGDPLTVRWWYHTGPQALRETMANLPNRIGHIRLSIMLACRLGYETCDFRWHLMPLLNPQQFRGAVYEDQIRQLPPEYGVASVVEEITKCLLAFHKCTFTGHDKWEGARSMCRTRSKDRDPNAERFYVSYGNAYCSTGKSVLLFDQDHEECLTQMTLAPLLNAER